jgi:chemotaxis-related protein WspD
MNNDKTAPMPHCWRHIGVYGGNHTCPRLLEEIHCRNCAVFREAARGLLRRETEPLPPLSSALTGREQQGASSVLVFRLGNHWLGLGCQRIAEVAVAREPRRVAHRVSGRMEGLVAVRGELHLCVALIEVMQLGLRSEISGERSRLLLLTPPQAAAIAFRASEVMGLRPILASEIEEVPATLPTALASCLAGVVPFEHGRLALLQEAALIQAIEEALYT